MTKAEKLAMNPARAAREAAKDQAGAWTPPVLRTVGVKREGIDDMVAALDRHAQYLRRAACSPNDGGAPHGTGRRDRRTDSSAVACGMTPERTRGWTDRIPELESRSDEPIRRCR